LCSKFVVFYFVYFFEAQQKKCVLTCIFNIDRDSEKGRGCDLNICNAVKLKKTVEGMLKGKGDGKSTTWRKGPYYKNCDKRPEVARQKAKTYIYTVKHTHTHRHVCM